MDRLLVRAKREGLSLIVGRPISICTALKGKPSATKERRTSMETNEATRQAAKLFGNSEEEIVQYGVASDDESSEDMAAKVAKMFGNSEDDLKKYGGE
jgi:hypothetical protein